MKFIIIFTILTDLENDKIKITCDDDLKFFMEECACNKLVFDFNPETELELSRKRSRSQMNDSSEGSKKLRKQLREFDLSSDSSVMDTDDDLDLSPGASTSFESSKNSSVVDFSSKETQDEMQPSTSADALKQSPKVNIISVDIIKTSENELNEDAIEIPDDNGNDVQIVSDDKNTSQEESAANFQVIEADETSKKEEEATQGSCQQNVTKKKSETNRIVISDSSDDETTGDRNNNRRFSDCPRNGAYSSSYSFCNSNGNRYESRAYYGSGAGGNSCPRRPPYSSQFRRSQSERFHNDFQDQIRAFQRSNAEHIQRLNETTRQAARTVRASTAAIPDFVSNFRAHFFHPLFRVTDINQQVFAPFNRR